MGANEQASVWAVAAQWLLWTRIPHARSWLPIRFQYQYRYRPPRVPQMVSRLTTRPFFTYPCRFLARLQLNRVLSRRISEWEGLTQRQKGENAEPPELFYATAPQNPLPKAWIRALTLSPPCPGRKRHRASARGSPAPDGMVRMERRPLFWTTTWQGMPDSHQTKPIYPRLTGRKAPDYTAPGRRPNLRSSSVNEIRIMVGRPCGQL